MQRTDAGEFNLDNFRYLTGLGQAVAEGANWLVGRARDRLALRSFGPDEQSANLVLHLFAPGYGPSHEMMTYLRSLGIEEVGGRESSKLRDGQSAIRQMFVADCEAESTVEIVRWTGANCETVVCPLPYLVNFDRRIKGSHSVYLHTLTPSPDEFEDPLNAGMNYVGITKQGWQKRFSQHWQAAKAGSPLLFHRALRDWYGRCKISEHRILGAGMDEEAALDLEFAMVEGSNAQDIIDRFGGTSKSWVRGTLYPRGLNMIPGGKAGIAYLHKLGVLAAKQPIDIGRREELLSSLLQDASREGKPNPLLAALWCDDDYAERIICGPSGRLKRKQIADARILASFGKNPIEISEAVGAKNSRQVARLLSGRTYSRIKD